MVTVKKGKMDEAVTARKCKADFSDYTPVMTAHYVEMVDLGVSPADITQTYDQLNTVLEEPVLPTARDKCITFVTGRVHSRPKPPKGGMFVN